METKEQKTVGGWFCAHCQRGVDPSEVTFRETHEVCGRMIANDEPPAADIVTERDSLLSVQKQLVDALEPFASVAEHDIGEDEADSDLFVPINLNMAEKIRVGDLRKARAAILAAKASS